MNTYSTYIFDFDYGVLNGMTTRKELLVYPHIKIADSLKDLV
ncbi:hypothetical protein [Elizabethkingia meningoseptica]|nr:hypothetical protein [Elizabethkingia meningoseptica]